MQCSLNGLLQDYYVIRNSQQKLAGGSMTESGWTMKLRVPHFIAGPVTPLRGPTAGIAFSRVEPSRRFSATGPQVIPVCRTPYASTQIRAREVRRYPRGGPYGTLLHRTEVRLQILGAGVLIVAAFRILSRSTAR
jgi:hypothetical protein